MDDTYVHNLEDAVELMIDKNQTLEKEKEQAENKLKMNKEYIRNVIKYLTYKLEESNGDIWETLQEISKLDKRVPVRLKENKSADLVSDYVCQRLGITAKGGE